MLCFKDVLHVELATRSYSSVGWQTMSKTLRCVFVQRMWFYLSMATLECQQLQEAWQVYWASAKACRNSYFNKNCVVVIILLWNRLNLMFLCLFIFSPQFEYSDIIFPLFNVCICNFVLCHRILHLSVDVLNKLSAKMVFYALTSWCCIHLHELS